MKELEMVWNGKAGTVLNARPRAGALWVVPALLLFIATGAEGQLRASYTYGADISPAFEGWKPQDDGTHTVVFGYMNRNWEEHVHVPIGPDNYFSVVPVGALDDFEVSGYDPAFADQGQPSVFLPRRNRFIFEVPVPPEVVAGTHEIVWTLNTRGSPDRAYGSLVRDYLIDNMVIMSETGSLGAGSSNERTRSNEPPAIEVEGGDVRTVRVGEPLRVVATVKDDGIPNRGGSAPSATATPQQLLNRALNPPRRITVGKVNGLYFSWFVYRGEEEAQVAFDPPQVKPWEDTRAFANSPWAPFWVPPPLPEDDRWVTEVIFDRPGTYVLRGRADDGGLFSDVEITVHVTEPIT
jgi:hypothetical protein